MIALYIVRKVLLSESYDLIEEPASRALKKSLLTPVFYHLIVGVNSSETVWLTFVFSVAGYANDRPWASHASSQDSRVSEPKL